MLDYIFSKLKTIKLWQLLLISLVLSEAFTGIMNTIMGWIWWRRIDIDLLLIGTVDAFVVGLIVTIIVIMIFQQIRNHERRSEARIVSALAEKEVLLKEIHHRVKNNLNVIASLLSLQSRYITDQTAIGIFEECRNRINSMALIHEKLYQARDFSRVDFKEYLNSLISMLSSSHIAKRDKVSVSSDIQDIYLDIDTAMTCGLVINELVTNSLKHAFPGNQGGMINISLLSRNDERILSVADNGIGLPDEFDLPSTNTLGLKMVKMLTKQLEGRMHIIVKDGTEIGITF